MAEDAVFHLVLYDPDGPRLADEEQGLRNSLARFGVRAMVEPVACHLEISRQGLTGRTPAMRICVPGAALLLSAERSLDGDLLDDCARRLARMQKQKSSTPSVPIEQLPFEVAHGVERNSAASLNSAEPFTV